MAAHQPDDIAAMLAATRPKFDFAGTGPTGLTAMATVSPRTDGFCELVMDVDGPRKL
jgi:hypothetical protein